MPKYMEQFERAKRYHERLRKIIDAEYLRESTEYYEDDVRSFFVHCYHVKDWIENDADSAQVSNKVKKHVDDTESLRICREICHGVKHLELTKPPRPSPQWARDMRIQISEGPSGESSGHMTGLRFRILHDGEERDAFELATSAMEAWRSFIDEMPEH